MDANRTIKPNQATLMQPNKIRVQYLSRKGNALESENANRKINELVRIFYYSLLFGLSLFTFPLQTQVATGCVE